jgi:Flp pilus assembly protein TadD
VGRALVANGRASEALQKLLAASDAGTDPQVFEYLGVAHSQLGQLPEAAAALERAVELAPSSASAWRRLAQVRLTRADAGGAVAAWRRALQVAPTDATTIRLEAKTLLDQAGKADEAKFFSEGGP